MEEENKEKINGRPTKWKDEYCELLIAHMSQGLSFRSFGAIADVCEETLHAWKREKPSFSESYHKGLLKSLIFWEKLGVGQSTGKLKGSAKTWEFNMKNRFGWRDRIEVEKEENNELTITIKEFSKDE